MNKKQLIVNTRGILAFILDLIIMLFIASIIAFVLGVMIFSIFRAIGLYYSELSNATKDFIRIIDFVFKIFVIMLYFWWIPKKIGNTFGRKLLKIPEKFNLFWTWPFLSRNNDFSQKHLKQDEVLKVVVEGGKWICPSCNEPSLEVYDTCSNCGQEIEKNKG